MFYFLRDWWLEFKHNSLQGDAEHISYWSLKYWDSKGWK